VVGSRPTMLEACLAPSMRKAKPNAVSRKPDVSVELQRR
jgi:hypothetical protein